MKKQETIHLSILTTFSTHNWTKKNPLTTEQNCSKTVQIIWSEFSPSQLWLVMPAYALLLTTLFITAENTS